MHCTAMQCKAKQCKAMQSNEKQCNALRPATLQQLQAALDSAQQRSAIIQQRPATPSGCPAATGI
eukprot:7246288-Alexandrium_andersonii.AAC.1